MTDNTALQAIDAAVTHNDVVLFMKGTPQAPQCGFSAAVTRVLSQLGVRFAPINVLADDALRQGIKSYSDWPTIPQLYVKGEFIGGCDIVLEMHNGGELEQLFKDRGLLPSPPEGS